VNWGWISSNQKLSEDFIREFQKKVDWGCISATQKLSEGFIREFQEKVNWDCISAYQKLSEEFIREFQKKVNWDRISANQKLSEEFIREFQEKVYWDRISANQKLSKKFCNEFKDKIFLYTQKKSHQTKTLKQKTKEIRAYAKKHSLKFDGKFLFAFREHDQFGRGIFNKTISYEKGKYYQDWRCDMNVKNQNSFGLGILTKGNTPVRVSVKDWGVAIKGVDGKARVFGFEVL
jgi:hypothetical protein